MKVKTHQNASSFFDDAGKMLVETESENNLLIGIVSTMIENPSLHPDAFLATINNNNGEIVGAAIQTPPFSMVITHLSNDGIAAFTRHLYDIARPLPGVMGAVHVSTTFSREWCKITGLSARKGMGLRNYKLTKVSAPPSVAGTFRPFRKDEFDLARNWIVDFCDEQPAEIHKNLAQTAFNALEAGGFYLWEDASPKSMAANTGSTPNGSRISFVYTPPSERGKGYSSACVAALSQYLLDDGNRFCFLNADLDNPISNAVYGKIGYVSVEDIQEHLFF